MGLFVSLESSQGLLGEGFLCLVVVYFVHGGLDTIPNGLVVKFLLGKFVLILLK